ncbi:uncharacterized protein G2W53_014218 [Senna tora]|uniref:Uncharacterized protein n=1 Tax=Senna tora TaxID=362788 RepID=A0A835C5D8_9FABA|nr:uncharacterized protein G2W53_014218 [Senna tora]
MALHRHRTDKGRNRRKLVLYCQSFVSFVAVTHNVVNFLCCVDGLGKTTVGATDIPVTQRSARIQKPKKMWEETDSSQGAKKLRKESKATKQTLEASTSAEQLEILSDLSTLFAEGNPISESMAEEKTLREHAAPQVNQAPLCIATPTLQAPLELKSGLIHLLPKFRRLMNKDPY